ncbi:MAG: cytochrome c [Acidobacteriota bacterium]|nr:cytochrome c [Acidobacteriota bacterium]
MQRQVAFLSALLLLFAIPLFSQTKEPAKEPAKQPAQQSTQQPSPPAQPPAQQPAQQPVQPPTQETPSGPIVIPPEAAKVVNPVKPTAASIAAGKQRFTYDCAMCHNANGDGKGDLAQSMNLKMPDFRDPEALKSVTDGGLFYVISKGHNPMPDEGSRAKPEEIWNLVNYVRSLAEKKTAQKTK